MASIISAGTTSGTALNMTGDTSGQLQLATGASATTAVTIDASQNVGIGTTSPTAKLDVVRSNNGVAFRAYNSGNSIGCDINVGTGNVYFEDTTGNNFYAFNPSSNYLWFGTNGSERMRIDSSGNVGIGTTSPSYALDVQSATTTGVGTVIGSYNTASSGSSISTLRIRSAGTGASYWDINTGNTASGLNGSIRFFDNIASAERMRIDSSGNVLVTGSGGLGYGTGSGGTVTQLTSKSTAVTINKPSGRITTTNSALAGSTSVRFQVNNSACSATDTIIVNVWESGISLDTYQVWAFPGNTNGYFFISLRNISGGSASDIVSINYTIIKGSTS